MEEPVPNQFPTDPNQTPTAPTPPGIEPEPVIPQPPAFDNPAPMPPAAEPIPTPEPPAPPPAPENMIAGSNVASPDNSGSFVPPPAPPTPDLANPEPPFAPAAAETPMMVRGENSIPPVEAQNLAGGVTTATILPVNSSSDLISVPSSGGARRFIIPAIIAALVFLILVAGGILFFQNRNNSTNNSTATESPTPTEEATSSAEETPDTGTPTGTQEPTSNYVNQEFGFTIDYPQTWTKAEATLGNVVTFTDPTTGLTPTKISVREESTVSDLETYVNNLKKLSTQLYSGFTNTATTPTTVGSQAGMQLENTYVKGTANVHMLQMVVIKGGKAFTITAECEDSVFETNQPIFTQVLASLNFTN